MAHQGWVWAVAFSPDGKTVLTGSDDKTARLWDAATGQPIGQPMVHQDWVNAVAFSPDGKAVLTGSSDKTARLWDAADGRPLGQPMAHQDAVRAVAFSPDGKTVLTGSCDKTARLWDAAAGQPLGQPMAHQGRVWAVAFSPDGKTVLTGSGDNTARLWDAADRHAPSASPWRIRARSGPWRSAPTARPSSPGATTRRRGSGTPPPAGPRASPWRIRARSGQCRGVQPRRQDRPHREQGQRRRGSGTPPTGQPIGQPMVHQAAVNAVAFSPDGKTVLTGSDDKTARLWDAADGQPLGQPMAHQDAVKAVAFSPDGKTVLTGSATRPRGSGTPPTGAPLGQPMVHQGTVRAVAFSPDGKTILTGSDDKTARLWDAATGTPIGQPMVHQDSVWAVAFSPDGKTILTGSGDKTARLWDAADGAPRPAHGAPGRGQCRGVQPRRQDHPHRGQGQHRAALACTHGNRRRAKTDRTLDRGDHRHRVAQREQRDSSARRQDLGGSPTAIERPGRATGPLRVGVEKGLNEPKPSFAGDRDQTEFQVNLKLGLIPSAADPLSRDRFIQAIYGTFAQIMETQVKALTILLSALGAFCLCEFRVFSTNLNILRSICSDHGDPARRGRGRSGSGRRGRSGSGVERGIFPLALGVAPLQRPVIEDECGPDKGSWPKHGARLS